MNKRNLLYSLFALVGLSAVVFLMNGFSNTETKTINPNASVYQEQGIDGAIAYYYKLKADPVTGKVDQRIYAQTKNAVDAMRLVKGTNMQWAEMGPNNIGGRTRALLIDKDSSNVLYAGGVAGGLWRSRTNGQSWDKIQLADNIAISCIAQDPVNGYIYVGTGEGLVSQSATNVYTSGFYGGGVYRSTDGMNFTLLSSTTNYKLINRIAIDKNHRIYLATTVGLKVSTDDGGSWSQVKMGSFKDVKIAPNSTRVFATSGANTYVSTDGTTFTQTGVPSVGIGRVEIAISPSDPDVVYAVLAGTGGDFKGIYRTTNGGDKWSQVAIGGSSSFNLFGDNNQGKYDNVAMVNLTNPDILYVGGIDMWKGEKQASGAFSWIRLTAWHYPVLNPHYVHADQHVYVQVPGQANSFYAGTDGGIFKTTDGGASFVTLNRNYNVTQFYAVATHPFGGVIGGAQDNGTVFMDFSGNNPQEGRHIYGGDGGWAAASALNSAVIFASVYNSSIARSADFGSTFQNPSDPTNSSKENFYNQDMIDNKVHKNGPFVSNVILWENRDFANSLDTVYTVADTNYQIGDTLVGRSMKNNRYPFYYILTSSVNKGDTVKMADPIQSRLFFGTKNKIYMTPEALYFVNKTPLWYVIANTSGTVDKLRISKDGDYLYYTINNKLYRLSGLLTARDSSSMDVSGSNYQITNKLIYSASGFITSMAIDPADANRLAITIGGFSGGYKHVYYSANATAATPSFAPKGGNLPSTLPVYAGLIPINNSKQMIIGTEFGMMFTDDITAANPNWVSANNGIDEDVPVYMLTQQIYQQSFKRVVVMDNGTPVYSDYPGIYNYGMIYAATHGRGFFATNQYVGIPEITETPKAKHEMMKLYPNPATDYTNIEYKLNKTSNVHIQIYDLSGRLVKEENLGTHNGVLKERINLNSLETGTYIIQMQAGNQTAVNKFIKR
jgi:hypothetical protein